MDYKEMTDNKDKELLLKARREINESKEIIGANKATILEIDERLSNAGKSLKTRRNYLVTWTKVAKEMKKDFRTLTEEDIDHHIARIREKGTMNENSLNSHKIRLKILLNMVFSDNPPSWIKGAKSLTKARIDKEIRKDDLLTNEDIQRMVAAEPRLINRTLIKMLYETGARISEILGLRLSSVSFSDRAKEAVIYLENSKTKKRPLLVIGTYPELKRLVEEHPFSHQSDVALFCHCDGTPLKAFSVSKMLDTVAKKAGLTKRVHPHLFRHSRVTHDCAVGVYSQTMLNNKFGWTRSSNMLSLYDNNDMETVHNIERQLAGQEIQERKSENLAKDIKKVVSCAICDKEYPVGSQLCAVCNVPIPGSDMFIRREKQLQEQTEMMKMMERLERLAPMLEQLMASPKFNEALGELNPKRENTFS